MKTEKLFPTLIAQGTLGGASGLNRSLLREIHRLAARDRLGREWSRQHYRGGYTSYASLSDLHFRAPVFARFADELQPHAETYARAQGWDLKGFRLEMTACWMNIMPRHTYHTLHLHPHSVISGAYYVSTPAGSVSLKLEDPRMAMYMNAPVRGASGKSAREKNGLYYEVRPRPGGFVLFESWLRHEVPPNQSVKPRVGLSFNYSLEPLDSD